MYLKGDSWIEMQNRLGEQKIDLVVHVNGKEFLPIEKIAKMTGVEI